MILATDAIHHDDMSPVAAYVLDNAAQYVPAAQCVVAVVGDDLSILGGRIYQR